MTRRGTDEVGSSGTPGDSEFSRALYPPVFRQWLIRTMSYSGKTQSIPLFIFAALKGSEDRYTVRIGDHYRAFGRLSFSSAILDVRPIYTRAV